MAKLNVGGGIQGGMQGGSLGYQVGGPPGAAVGGTLGFINGLFGGGQDRAEKLKQNDPFTQQQRGYANNLLQGAQSQQGNSLNYINSILSDDPQAMQQFQQPSLDNFKQNILPEIAQRFAGTGGSSSAFQQTLGQAGKDLETSLSAQRQQLKDRALQQLLSMGQTGLGGAQQPYIQGGAPGWMSQTIPAAAQGLNAFAQSGDFNNVLGWLKDRLGFGGTAASTPATSANVTGGGMPQRQQLPGFMEFGGRASANPNAFRGFNL
jgi:hypothetical protein